MRYFNYYLIGINIVGLILFIINSHIKVKLIDILLSLISLFFGSFGIIIGMIMTKDKIQKDNMISRVFVLCSFVIETIILFILKDFYQKEITLNVYAFLYYHQLFSIYLITINIITFIVFGIDKIKAISHQYRIKITTLLSLSFIGGSLGALIGMYTFKHKTKVNYFTIGVPLMLLMHIIIIFFIMNI